MPVVVSPDSEYSRELAKWNAPRPHPAYPKMLYRAIKRDNGKVMVIDPLDEAFNARCQFTVMDEAGEARARAQGWRESPQEALDHFEGLERDIAQAAAERLHSDQRMGEKARTEAAAADDSTPEHLPEIPEHPIKRGPGRPRKDAS